VCGRVSLCYAQRAYLTIAVALLECLYASHLFACLLALTTVFRATRLDTWYATLGYCQPVVYYSNNTQELDPSGETCRVVQAQALELGLSSNDYVDGVACDASCVPAFSLYLQCFWWSMGLLMGAPISLTPNPGPYEQYTYAPDHLTLLSESEQLVVIAIKSVTAFMWTTVIARFVQVYNNLDPDASEFRMGWDALNRFVTYFKVPKPDALELRRYYIERAEEARAKSRKRVMNNFSPMLAEKFVWKLNKEWLVRVPCFTLVVQRLLA